MRVGAVDAVVAGGDLGDHTIRRHGFGEPRRHFDDGAGSLVVGVQVVTDFDIVGPAIHAIDDDVSAVVQFV